MVSALAPSLPIWLLAGSGSFPPVPTRAQVCGMQLTFQGLTVQTAQFGALPWFEPAIAWLTPADRQAVYAAKHAAGDTHLIIGIPSGTPLYDEPNQPYSADRFGPLDWTNGETVMDQQFVALVQEVIQAGFIPAIFCREEQEHSMKQAPIVADALRTASRDLNDYTILFPGWDGVFYGWADDQHAIPAWAALARQHGAKYLGLEHNPGHIPLGEGGGDYLPGGKMADFDVVVSEFDFSPGLDHSDQLWQIVARMVRPFTRPPDMPAGDDPNPPFYLVDSARGPRFYCAFEWSEYLWVRGRVSKDQIDQDRAYLRAMGCRYTG